MGIFVLLSDSEKHLKKAAFECENIFSLAKLCAVGGKAHLPVIPNTLLVRFQITLLTSPTLAFKLLSQQKTKT